MSKQPNQVTIYACGGAGTNIVQILSQHQASSEAETNSIFAKPEIICVDTSDSNLPPSTEHEVFLVTSKTDHDGKSNSLRDGSGQKRDEHAQEIIRQIPNLLMKHPPQDVVILLGSLSGGSGSVFIPTLAAELVKRNKIVVVVGMCSTNTAKFTSNTHNTFLSLAGASRTSERPIAVYYRENDGASRQSANKEVLTALVSLLVLFSGKNQELDSADLYNWLNYDRVTDYKPALVRLDILDGGSEWSDDDNRISVATITTHDKPTSLEGIDYEVTGYLSGSADSKIVESLPVHFVLNNTAPVRYLSQVKTKLSDYEERRQAAKHVEDILGDIETGDSGLVL